MKTKLLDSQQVFYSWRDVKRITAGKSRSTIWRWTQQGHFPESKRIGPNSVAWLKSDIDSWIESNSSNPVGCKMGEGHV